MRPLSTRTSKRALQNRAVGPRNERLQYVGEWSGEQFDTAQHHNWDLRCPHYNCNWHCRLCRRNNPPARGKLMSRSLKQTWAIATLALLTACGLISAYQTLFDLWMTAYPYVNASAWAARFYVRLATTLLIGIAWGAVATWLFRARRKHSRAEHTRDDQSRSAFKES